MSDMTKMLIAIIILLVAMTGTFFLGYYFRSEKIVERQLPAEIVRDTIAKEIRKDSIVIKYMPGQIEYIDTGKTIETKPFVAKADTIIKHDTVHVEYSFPQNNFAFALRTKPDTTYYINTTIEKTFTIDKTPSWWVTTLTHVGASAVGAALGYGAGRIK